MPDRRQSILDAAMPVFVRKGYSGTTIADIRKASGATTGSIYHFFNGKPDLALALWREANQSWLSNAEALREGREPEDMITSSVRGLLQWATQDRPLFLFFEELRIRAHSDPELATLLQDIKETHEEAAQVYAGWAEAGLVKDLPWPLVSALVVGPAYDYLRKSGEVADHDASIEILAQQAWDAVKA